MPVVLCPCVFYHLGVVLQAHRVTSSYHHVCFTLHRFGFTESYSVGRNEMEPDAGSNAGQ